MQDLGTLGGTSSSAIAINDAGQVVGAAYTAEGQRHAFVWDATHGMRDLGTLGGTFSVAYLIDDTGAAAGQALTANGEFHGFFVNLSDFIDLQITDLITANNQAPQGSKITITATIKNTGTLDAGASTTAFLDGTRVIGSVSTPAIPAGQSVSVSIDWRTATENGPHTLFATADSMNVIVESGSETNNTKAITVNVLGNQVR